MLRMDGRGGYGYRYIYYGNNFNKNTILEANNYLDLIHFIVINIGGRINVLFLFIFKGCFM